MKITEYTKKNEQEWCSSSIHPAEDDQISSSVGRGGLGLCLDQGGPQFKGGSYNEHMVLLIGDDPLARSP